MLRTLCSAGGRRVLGPLTIVVAQGGDGFRATILVTTRIGALILLSPRLTTSRLLCNRKGNAFRHPRMTIVALMVMGIARAITAVFYICTCCSFLNMNSPTIA